MLNLNPTIPFRGFQEDLKLSEDIVKDIRRMHIQSDTYLDLRIAQREIAAQQGDKRSLKILPKLCKLNQEIYSRTLQFRDALYGKKLANEEKFQNYDEFASILKKYMVKGKVANCAEQAYLAQAKLKSHNKDSKAIYAHIHDKRTDDYRINGQHVFLVLGLDKNAKISEPKTWGTNAIIVDPWSGLVKRANQGLKTIKDLFIFDSQKEYIVFEDGDLPDNFFINKS